MDYQRFRDHVDALPNLEMQSGMLAPRPTGPTRFRRLRRSFGRDSRHQLWLPWRYACWGLFLLGWWWWWVVGPFHMVTATFSSYQKMSVEIQPFRVDEAAVDRIALGLPVKDEQGKVVIDPQKTQIYILDIFKDRDPQWANEPACDEIDPDRRKIVIVRTEMHASHQDFVTGLDYLHMHEVAGQYSGFRVYYYTYSAPESDHTSAD